MASVLKVLLAFLHKLFSSANNIKRFPRRLALFLAFLGSRFSVWLRPLHGVSASSRTVSRNLAGLRENLVACSTVSTSPSVPNLQDLGGGTRQQAIAISSADAIPPTDGTTPANLSSTNLSVHSSASDRPNIITHSLESLHAAVDRPSRLAAATNDELGQGQDASQSRERQSRSSSSADHLHDRIIPAVGLAVPPSLTGVVVDNPTELLPTSSSTNSQRLMNDPYVIGSSPAHSSYPPLHTTVEESSQRPPPTPPDIRLSGGCTLRQMHSEEVPRYTKGIKIPGEKTRYTIEPLTGTFPYFPQGSPNEDCHPWTHATHPGGALYFFDPARRLFTDTDMHDPTLRAEIENCYDSLQDILRHGQPTIRSNNYDLVLDKHLHDKQIQWSYYYACHETRCLFWLHSYDATDIISELFGVKSPAHVKHRLEALYWNHWSLYPNCFPGRHLSVSICDELIGLLSHGCVDSMTSNSPTLPYNVDTMQKMIEIVKNAKEADSSLEHHVTGISRLLSRFAIWRFLNFHGQPHARLVSHQTVYSEPKDEPSLFFTLSSIFYFSVPGECLRDIKQLSTDNLITATAWESFMDEKSKEWTDLTIPATVMLAVNLSLLAIPGLVLSDSDARNLTSRRQIILIPLVQSTSSLSILASMVAIVLGLILVRFKLKESEYPDRHTRWFFSRPSMAVVFSLPWLSLMWSVAFFAIALALSCIAVGDTFIRVPIAVTAVITYCSIVVIFFRFSNSVWDDIAVVKDIYDRNLASVKHFALSIFRPRSHGAHPTPELRQISTAHTR